MTMRQTLESPTSVKIDPVFKMGSLEHAYLLQDEIRDLKDRIKEKEDCLKDILYEHSHKGVLREGDFEIYATKRDQRKIEANLFIQQFPEIADRLVSIPVTKAEEELAKDFPELSPLDAKKAAKELISEMITVKTTVSNKVRYSPVRGTGGAEK
jgi:hypothetical protein